MRKLISLLAIVVSVSAMAQVNTYYLSDWNAQGQWNYNPAVQSKEKVFLYLPGLAGFQTSFGHTGFSYSDGIVDKQVDFGGLIDGLDDQNHLLNEFNIPAFALGLKFGNVQLRVGATSHLENRFTYTRDFLELAWKGNGHPDLIGQRLSLDGTAINSFAYANYFLGGSVSLMDNKLNLGTNLNFYNGVAAAYTENTAFGLRTNADDYTITIDGSFDYRTSGADSLEFDELEARQFLPLSVDGNQGFGLDVGLTYKPIEKLTLEASATDIGTITWVQKTKNYQLSNQEISYAGFELDEFLNGSDSTSSTIQQFTDSITDLFTPEENSDEFTTTMNRNIFLAGRYELKAGMSVTGFFNNRNSFGTSFNSVGGMFHKEFGRALQLRAGLQLFNMKDALVPVGFIVNGGPVQFSLHTDNILAVIQPKKAKYLTGVFSLSFRFRKERE